jgi:hypothetical protein
MTLGPHAGERDPLARPVLITRPGAARLWLFLMGLGQDRAIPSKTAQAKRGLRAHLYERPTERALCERLHRQSAQQGGGFKLEGNMLNYDELVELARICLKQARETKNPNVSSELRHVAKGYQMRAATMKNGRLPDIGEE